jgi:aminoglycoside/choline kinase family phosphotransferase
MRAALQALLQFQTQVPAAGLPAPGEAQLAEDLALFPAWCIQREFGITWTAAEQALWTRVATHLVGSAAAQPVVAVRGRWGLADGEQAPGAVGAVAGPITSDLVALLRDTPHTDDEAVELDWAVRWWEGARRAGLPVEADFGEFWRALEWMGLHRQLVRLGRQCRECHEAAANTTGLRERLAPGLAAASKVALRYGPLKPLLRLLPPAQGAAVGAGYTF